MEFWLDHGGVLIVHRTRGSAFPACTFLEQAQIGWVRVRCEPSAFLYFLSTGLTSSTPDYEN